MLRKYFPALWAVLLLPLGYYLNPLALLAIPLGFASLLTFSEADHPWYTKIGVGWLAILLLSALNMTGGHLQLIAWAIYIFGRPYWGPQRSFIAFPFLMLSAEALPYYVPMGLEAVSLSESVQGWELWHAWYYRAGKFGSSMHLLLAGLFLFLTYRDYKSNKSWNTTLAGLTIIIMTIPFGFAFSDLNFEEAVYLKSWLVEMSRLDSFIARLSFFLSFFLILFAVVRRLLPKQNADDRFT